jgi:sulfur relay (sulfurtransferase) DsrC/TusE family protein
MAKKQKLPVVITGKDNEVQNLSALEVWAEEVSQTPSPGNTHKGFIADHFKVMDCVRQYYDEFGAIPPVRLIVRRTGLSLRCLHELFPDGYSRSMYWKIHNT